MVVYFVEIDDTQSQTSLNSSVDNMSGIEFQGILNKYRNQNGKRVAIFVVSMGTPQLKFKRKYVDSTQKCPIDLPPDVHKFFNI